MARARKTYRESPDSSNVIQLTSPDGRPWRLPVGRYIIDFERWKYLNWPTLPAPNAVWADRDAMVHAVKEAVWDLMQGGATEASIFNLCRSGVRHWFAFLDELAIGQRTKSVTSLEQIDKKLIERYISWLRRRPSSRSGSTITYTSARAIYSATKSVLSELVRTGHLRPGIFPLNPFPSAGHAYQGQSALSKGEMERVMSALAVDLQSIREGRTLPGTQIDVLYVYFILIAARSGRNQTPLLELTVDAIQPHPLSGSMLILSVYKRRGYRKQDLAIRMSETAEESASVQSDIGILFREVKELTLATRQLAPPSLQKNLWLKRGNGSAGVKRLSAGDIAIAAQRFVERHNLVADQPGDDGEPAPLRLNVSRLRQTFAQGMWVLSGGNLMRTSKLLGNLPSVTDSHYLDVTPEMQRNHKFVGTILHATITEKTQDMDFRSELGQQLGMAPDQLNRLLDGEMNTGVGRCTDYLHGRYAPRNGRDVCTRFLHCFRCPNQVVMESDLHRLFSFYWLLLKERALLGRNRWKQVYSWVIREIDDRIAPQFNPKLVQASRERARTAPHPMWRDRSALGVHFE